MAPKKTRTDSFCPEDGKALWRTEAVRERAHRIMEVHNATVPEGGTYPHPIWEGECMNGHIYVLAKLREARPLYVNAQSGGYHECNRADEGCNCERIHWENTREAI